MRLSFLMLFLAAAASAEVTDSAPGGFTVQHEITVAAERATAYETAVERVGDWWNPEHTLTGDPARLRIEPRAMGCFCEELGEGNAVVHLVVTFVNRDIIVRLTGGLGPLGLMGVTGNMTWEFFDTESGGTRIRWTYAVGGYRPGGLGAVALPVDAVIGDALARLGAYLETGDPEAPPADG
ncbi:MAG: SRPBCC family protein [Woeseiaceae bacterium]|jgi:hypothetical protein|nr:SRPBCC family protein [Woeseiaceae bacterium]